MNKKYTVPGLVITAMTLAIVGATYASNTGAVLLRPAGTIAASEKRLMIFALALSLIVVIPVFIMLFGFAWKYRDGRGAKHTPGASKNIFLETIWWGVPLIMIVVLSMVTWRSSHELDPFQKLNSPTKPLTIQVVALEWKWLFIYPDQHMATVNFVQFPKNTPVTFQITADAPMNSFFIPKLGGQMYAMPGMSTQLHLMADRTGDFRGLSANLSGEGFEGMHFTARSSSQADFNKWVHGVHNSGASLTSAAYAELVKPSQNNKPLVYASAEHNLYTDIQMKYMMPGINSDQETQEHEHTDPSQPGMQHMEGMDVE